ncbi:hypothetical protein PR048_019833 [Dryococelus australis]|uniref:CHK kinase-like domain-containing protein n=1 Tax=Dryococelus australis TaxID=614101 RepID=A0ABQ9H4L1_9NEOP|nr:hypothetical protein PR048_019833 [Dryococelus australis]
MATMLEAQRAWIRAALQRHVERTGQQLEVADPVPFESQGFEFYCPLFRVVARGSSATTLLVVKILPPEGLDLYLTARLQYRNESLFYGDFLRFLLDTAVGGREGLDQIKAIGSLFPKLFCAYEDDSQCLLALEDLTPSGFVHAPKILDLAHMKLSLRELGRLHALSYIAKKRNPKKFFNVVKRFNRWEEEMCGKYSILIHGMVQFCAELFRAKFPEDSEKYAHRLARLDAEADKFFKLTEPEEPLAVLCHADYNRNNIMFTYDAEGKPSSLKAIDFQLAMYSSPAIDLSLLLFLSTSPEVRDPHWDELLDTYRSSVLDAMELSLCCERDVLEQEYSREVLARDFGKFCLHGFLVTAFFLPVTMMTPQESEQLTRESPSETTAERVEAKKRLCSDEVKHRLAVLLKVMLERNFL